MKPKESLTHYPVMKYRRFRLAANHIVRFLMRLLFRVEYAGLENIPDTGPAILVANHTSMADMLVIHTVVKPWICWVSKKELFSTPLTRCIYTRLGCIPVDRGRTDLMAARGIISALRDKLIVGMFPQGTRVKPDRVPYVRPRTRRGSFRAENRRADFTGSRSRPIQAVRQGSRGLWAADRLEKNL
jgi:1-acyl-sn-glycerol-3-phosphate acyltransferase